MPRRKKCRHPTTVITWRGDVAFAMHCSTFGCGAVLSLGPANDELRAQMTIEELFAPDEIRGDSIVPMTAVDYELDRVMEPDCRDEEEPAPSRFAAWPVGVPRQYNGCGEPCDMWIGPCLCGATHTAEQRSAGGAS